MNVDMEFLWNDTDTGKPKYSDRILLLY